MEIGVLADIHEDIERLQLALALFRDRKVDRVVVLGDVFDHGLRIDETIEVLQPLNAPAVWGNHELGLADNPEPEIAARYTEKVADYFVAMRPSYQIDDLLFSHGPPKWDASDPLIYYIGDRPWTSACRDATFNHFPQRVFFAGHFHRWYIASQRHGPLNWNGEKPIVLDPTDRFLVVIHAVMNGWCAVFDDQTNVLTPIRLESGLSLSESRSSKGWQR